jgi:hypothetical protein
LPGEIFAREIFGREIFGREHVGRKVEGAWERPSHKSTTLMAAPLKS